MEEVSTNISALFSVLEKNSEDDVLKLVIADALDESGFCGDAMRWALKEERVPHKTAEEGDWFWQPVRLAWITSDRLIKCRLTPAFQDEKEIFPPGMCKGFEAAWMWLVKKFGQLRDEGKI